MSENLSSRIATTREVTQRINLIRYNQSLKNNNDVIKKMLDLCEKDLLKKEAKKT